MIMKIRENVFCSPKEQQRHEAKLIMPNGIDKQRCEAKISRRKPQRTRLPPCPLRYSSVKGMLVSVTSPSQEDVTNSLSHWATLSMTIGTWLCFSNAHVNVLLGLELRPCLKSLLFRQIRGLGPLDSLSHWSLALFAIDWFPESLIVGTH